MTKTSRRPQFPIPKEALLRITTTRHVAWLVAVGMSAILLGCGPEAPPCNDAEAANSVLGMVSDANDAHLQGYRAKSGELATFALETPTVTSYDDKLKLRSCKTTIVMTLKPDKLAQMNDYLANPAPNLFGALAALAGQQAALYPPQVREEIAYVRARSNGPVPADPIRKSLTYQIVKQEGSNDFVVSTNVSVEGTIQYLRAAAAAEQWSVARAQEAQAQQARQAEIDRLSASGNWRKAVYVTDFGTGHNDPYYCYKNQLYCVHGGDENGGDVAYYELDEKVVGQTGRDSIANASRHRQPVCLLGVHKTEDPQIFRAKGFFTTYQNEKGEAVGCLPGAQNTDASAPPAPSNDTPKNLMSVIDHFEMCGEEALCLYTTSGDTVFMNMATLEDRHYALLRRSAQAHTPVCLRDVTRDGQEATAEDLAERC